jgi:hypothetical protein
VGALVERMTDDETSLSLVNIDQVAGRTVVVQGGAYGEHQILSADLDGTLTAVGQPSLVVRLAPGSGARLVLRMKRYANQPTLEFPWA